MLRLSQNDFHRIAFAFLFSSLMFACSQERDNDGIMSATGDSVIADVPNSPGDYDKADLSQQLPLEFELNTAEKEELLAVLRGVYSELKSDEAESLERSAADPTEGCDRCGRETGFLPEAEIVIDQFLHVEMKALTFGLVSWTLDLEAVHDVISSLLGEEAPESIEMSYRMSIVRVEIEALSQEMIEEAIAGRLLSSESPEAISITSVDTNSEEIGLHFDHGFSYILYVNAIEGITKFSSPASEPIFIHCFLAEEGRDNGGCVQLNSTTAL